MVENLVTYHIAERIRANSQPEERTDGKKIALIPQGGAMRGSPGAGMGLLLADISGESNPFDVMYGVSSGAWTAAYFLSRQGRLGTSIYYDDLAYRRFISQINFFLRRPVVNMGTLANALTRGKKRLNAQAVFDSKVPLHIYVTSVKDGSSSDLYPYKSEEGLYKALLDTARPPHLSDTTDVTSYFDGCISPIGRVPVQQAIDDGCTDILVLWTDKDRPSNYSTPLIDRYVAWKLRKQFPELSRNYMRGHEAHRRTIALIKNAEAGKLQIPNIEVVRVKNKKLIPNSWETRPHHIKRGTKAGYEAMKERFSQYDFLKDRIKSFDLEFK